MSFDPHSLERLRKLGRQLPQRIPTPETPPKSNQEPSKNLHKVETEEDPQTLFRELMKASPDGTVPPHLMTRLKEVEEKQLSHQKIPAQDHINKEQTIFAKQSNASFHNKEENLYAAFKQLLMEYEEEL